MLATDIRSYLISLGIVGGATSWPVYCGYFPESSNDKMVAIFETAGMPADTLERENRRLSFQTRVRASRLDYQVAYDKWLEIFNALQDAQSSGGSPDYLAGVIFIQAMQVGPNHFNDENERPNLTSNWRVLRTI
jgi:hypothetical protein